MLSLIVAASNNNVIGKDNQLVWTLPDDMKFFKNTTWGMPVIMGRKTFASLGKALPARFNFVITRQADWKADKVTVCNSLADAIEKAASANCKESMVIGGGEIFKEAIGIADRIYLTRVDATVEGDSFFPEIDEAVWELASSTPHPADKKHHYAFAFQLWTRKAAK